MRISGLVSAGAATTTERASPLAKDFRDKFFYFAATFTDQPHHDYIGTGIACHHAEQNAFAYTTARK
jgi:hypothetical protein